MRPAYRHLEPVPVQFEVPSAPWAFHLSASSATLRLGILADCRQTWADLAHLLFRYAAPDVYEFGIMPPTRRFETPPAPRRLSLRILGPATLPTLDPSAAQTHLWQVLNSPHPPEGSREAWMYLGEDRSRRIRVQLRGTRDLKANRTYPVVTNWKLAPPVPDRAPQLAFPLSLHPRPAASAPVESA
jgi:hypothetical protein